MQYDLAHSLARAIQNSEEWSEYHRLKDEVTEDAAIAALIQEYKKLQLTLQMAAMAGTQGSTEDMRRFSGISALLFSKPEVSAYLLSEMRMQQTMADIFKILADAADIDLPTP